jgi:hypothetical protein
MDPLTALSIAGNIIQFVDFGSHLLGRAGALYRSPTGSLSFHDELQIVTTDLQTLVIKIQKSLPSANSQDSQDQEDTDGWSSFKRICDEAAKVADELVGRLARLKVQDGKHRRLRSLKHAVDSLWSDKEIAALLKRLSYFKEALVTRVLFSIRSVTSLAST